MRKTITSCVLPLLLCLTANPAAAQEASPEVLDILQRLEQRINSLEEQNRDLRAQIENDAVQAQNSNAPATPNQQQPVRAAANEPTRDTQSQNAGGSANSSSKGFVSTDHDYAYKMLDHAEDTNMKPAVQLEYVTNDNRDSSVTLSGGTVVLMDKQWSNSDSKFGYLMRHPTSANQIGKKVSEAVIHSAQLAVTAKLSDDFSAYAELLYNPQQSFGSGTITDLNRNQIQLRRGWVMFGNLQKRPVYALVGKMDVPFGLNDTVSPFTNSTNWHAFAGLAYGGQIGFKSGGLHLRAMAVQGGSQFRAANSEVKGTNVPSKLNNYALDGRYTLTLDRMGNTIMVGASYLHGSPYCQDYPVFHFNPCDDNVPAWAAFARAQYGPVTVLGEFASTTKDWLGTRVPDPNNELSVFDAVKARAFTVGSRFGFGTKNTSRQGYTFALSGEFSKFIAGDDGAPWERQNQAVLGMSWQPLSNINIFTEYVHIDGFVPLNFLSGGNFPDGSTWSEKDANSDVALIGAQVAF